VWDIHRRAYRAPIELSRPGAANIPRQAESAAGAEAIPVAVAWQAERGKALIVRVQSGRKEHRAS
jgi:hypothetical protein